MLPGLMANVICLVGCHFHEVFLVQEISIWAFNPNVRCT